MGHGDGVVDWKVVEEDSDEVALGQAMERRVVHQGAPRRQPVRRQPPCKCTCELELGTAARRLRQAINHRHGGVQERRCVTRTQPMHLPAGDRVAKPRGGVRVPCLTHPLGEEPRILTKKHIRTPITEDRGHRTTFGCWESLVSTDDVASLRWRQLAMIRRERPDRLDDCFGPLVAEAVKNRVAENRSTLRPRCEHS